MRSIKVVPQKDELRPMFKSIALIFQSIMDEQSEAIADKMEQRLKKVVSEIKVSDKYISKAEALSILGLGSKSRKLSDLKNQGLITYRGIGRSIQYLESSVMLCTNLPQPKIRHNGKNTK